MPALEVKTTLIPCEGLPLLVNTVATMVLDCGGFSLTLPGLAERDMLAGTLLVSVKIALMVPLPLIVTVVLADVASAKENDAGGFALQDKKE